MRRLAVLIMAILCLSSDICRALPYSWNAGTTWVTPGNWSPSGPPLAADDANFFGGGTGFVELNNGGAGHSVNTVDFNAGTPNFYLQDDYNFFTSFTDALNVGLSITKNGLNTVTMASMLINCPTLTVNSGAFDLIGTNVATFTTANINGGIVCVTGFYPSVITAGNWNVNSGGTLKGTGLASTTPGSYATIVGNVNVAAGGTLLAGCSPGTCNIQGNVVFAAGSQSVFELAVPNVVGGGSDLFNIDGDLTLSGTFDVVAVTGFGSGTYRLINYSGTFVNNGVALGNLPVGFSAQLDLSTTNQVNLIVYSAADCCPSNNAPIVCYTNTIYPGYNYLVNHLCPAGGSSFANPVDGLYLLHWNATIQDMEIYAIYDTFSGGWIDAGFSPISEPQLSLGETFVLYNPGATYTMTICGKEPVCPPPCLTNTTGFELVGRLRIGTATWTNLSSCPPVCGTEVRIWNPTTQGYSDYTFDLSGWTPSAPVVPVGYSVFVKVGTNINCTGGQTNQYPCPPVTISVRTGTDVNGALLGAGANEQVFQNISAPPGGNNLVVISPGGIPSVWSPANGISRWVGPQIDGFGPLGWYTNRWTFFLPCSTNVLTGRISTDDAGFLFINGTNAGPVGGFGFGFANVNVSSGFVVGWNTVDIAINNGSTYTGFRAELTNSYYCCCTNAPEVICSTNKTVSCGDTWSFDAPAIIGTNYSVSYTTTTNGPCPYSEYIRQWTIIDECGNTNYCSQTVTVTNPVPLLGCATNKSVLCGTAWSFDPPSVVNNSCDTTTTVLNTFTNGTCPKNVTRMWLVSNPCGFSNFCSQTVSIFDNTPPVVTCPTNKTVICGTAWTFDAPTATDDCGGTNVGITVVSTVTNGICPKVITRLWKLTDQCGNFANCFQQVTVSYASLVLNCTTNKTVPSGSAWTFDAPVLADSSCGMLNILTTYTNGTDCSKAISRIWVVTNTCGAYSTCTQTVSMVDSVAPVLCCPNDMTFTTCSNSVVVNFKVKVTDNLSSGLVAACNPPSGSSFPVGTTTVICTATDACGNVGTCSFKVTVKAGVTTTKTITIGTVDCFTNGVDYTPRSPALNSLGGLSKFDASPFPGTFGASFLGLPSSISCARLEIRLRPYTGNTNTAYYDKITLGLTNTSGGGQFAWTNNIGNQGSGGGLISSSWDFGVPACGRTFYIDLMTPPNGGPNLIPLMAASHRLDILVRSNTFVDYARLCYCYCASKPVWKGFEWDIANATLFRACDDVIIVKGTGSGTVTVGSAVGQTRGISYNFEPIGFVSATDGLTFRGQRVSGASPNLATVSGDGAGGMEFRSTAVRSNVTQIQVTLYNGNTAVSQATLAWSPTALIANTAAGAKFIRAGVSDNGDKQTFKLETPVLMGINGSAPAVADSIAIKFVGAPDVAGDMVEGYFFDTDIDTEIALTGASVMTGALETRVTGNAIAAVAADTTTVTSAEQSTNSVTGLTMPVTGGPIIIGPVLNGCNGWIIDRWMDVRLANVGNVKFTGVSNTWDVDCSYPVINSTNDVRYQVLNAGTVVADSGVNPVTTASVNELPSQWSFSTNTAQGIVRLNWAETALFTINGNSALGDELRIIPLGSNLPAPVFSTMTIESIGIEAITVTSQSATGPWTMLPLQISGGQITVQWTGPSGGILESSPAVTGPWLIVPNQTEFSTTLPMDAPMQFFRVRSN